MLSIDRPAFETELAVLFGGWPTFLTPPRIEAYWRGLAQMSLDVFARVVTRSLEGGEEKLPTVNRIWEISREMRRVAQAPAEEQRRAPLSICHAYGNRALYWYLWHKGGVTATSLQAILAAKQKLCDAYDLITSEEPEAGAELRDKLFAAWDAVWQPITREELDAGFAKFAQVGHL